MLTMTAAQRTYLETETERTAAIRLEIVKRTNGDLVYVIDSRDGYGTGEAQILPGGSVQADTAAEVLRTASLQIIDPDSELSVGIGALIGLDKRYRLYKGYWIPAEQAWWMPPLGEFELSGEPEIDASGGARTIHLQLGDKSCTANGRPRGGFITKALTASQGLTKLQAIQIIAAWETWQETAFNLWPDSTATIPWDYPWTDRDTPWAASQRVNSIPEPDGTITRLQYDPYGRLSLTPDPGPNIETLPSVWSAKVTVTGLSQLKSARRTLDVFKLRNAAKVAWGSQLVTPGSCLAYDNNPNSETYVGAIGWLPEFWLGGQQDELIRNLEEGQARANYELMRLLSFQEKIPLSILENPALEPWDVIYLEAPAANIRGNYQLLSFTTSLDLNAVQSCSAWRVRKIG